jgi:hypothetical protein
MPIMPIILAERWICRSCNFTIQPKMTHFAGQFVLAKSRVSVIVPPSRYWVDAPLQGLRMAAIAMQIVRRQWLLLILCSIAALGSGGCADMDILPTWVPFQGTISDTLPGVVTPAQRIAELHKWQAEAAKASPQQKQSISEQLVNSIRTEKDALIRTEIIRTLGAYPSAAADGILKLAMNDPDIQVRIAACDGWGKHHDDQAVELLGAAMSSDVASEVRLTAIKSLGETRNPAATKPLGDALNDTDPAMQYLAVQSLKKVSGKDFGNDVNRWQQYLRTGTPPPPPTLAERLRQWF